ncbi:PadR family transcriptional regulator [Streptoverticillium reticulum]|uniref:PadR family transcriptional regulator n=1 Tax=Streptoverticillium reticulum TaxID=1433415 RepID=UPI0039BFE09B
MPKRRKLSNPLALAVLVTLQERPRHPYDVGRVLRHRGKHHSIKINYGSLYTVVRNLEKHGFVETSDVERQGNRPERTLYRLTPAGRAELHDWLSELVAVPAKEFPLFESALSLLPALPADEAIALLGQRLAALEEQAAGMQGELEKWSGLLPRLVLIEAEFQLHRIRAEAAWVREFHAELEQGSFEGIAQWREMGRTGGVPEELQRLEEHLDQDRT